LAANSFSVISEIGIVFTLNYLLIGEDKQPFAPTV